MIFKQNFLKEKISIVRLWRTIQIMIGFVYLCCNIFSVPFFAQDTDDNQSVTQHLENIKEKLKKLKSQMLEDKSSIRKSKVKDKSNKIKKELMQKLSNPFIRDIRHKAIDIRPPNSQKPVGRSGQKENNKEKLTTDHSSLITKVLRENPGLMPFSLPDLKRFLKTATSQVPQANSEKGNSNLESFNPRFSIDPEYIRGLREWYVELSKNAIDFWLFFKRFFVDNIDGLEYLKNDICKGEFNKRGLETEDILLKGILDKDGIAKHLSLEVVINNIFYPLFMRGAHIGGPYTITDRIVLSCEESKLSPKHILKKTLCTNLARLDSFGRCFLASYLNGNKMMPMEYVYNCLVANKCEKVGNNVKQLDAFIKQWFKFASELFKKQLLPAVFDLCYNKCGCKSLGINCLGKNLEKEVKDKGGVTMLYYRIMKGEIETNVSKLISFQANLGRLIEDLSREKCSIASELRSYIERTLNDLSAYDVAALENEFRMLEGIESGGCPTTNTGATGCIFDKGVCKSQKSQQLEETCMYYTDQFSCGFGGCKWTGDKCIEPDPPNCRQFKAEECPPDFGTRCIWYNKECIFTDTYCAMLPPPGKGFFDTVLLGNILKKIGQGTQILNRFADGLVEVLNKSTDNIFCKAATFRSILSFGNLLDISPSYITNSVQQDKREKYALLFNMDKIEEIKVPILRGDSFSDITSFMYEIFNYYLLLDYNFLNYYLDYKAEKCSGKITSVEEYINTKIPWSDPDEIKEGKKTFFTCLYREKEFTSCWKKAFEEDKNYKLVKNIVDAFFSSIGNVKISELDTILQDLLRKGGVKPVDIIPGIREFCKVLLDGKIVLSQCKAIGSDETDLSRCCDGIREISDNLSQFSAGANMERCSQQSGCKLCWGVVTTSFSPIIGFDKSLSCNGCSGGEEKNICENLVNSINGICQVAVGADGQEKALENFLNNWQNLMEIIKNNYCSFKGINEQYCKNKISEDVIKIDFTGRRKIEKTARNKGYLSLYKQTLKEMLEDSAPLEKVDCNDLF